MSDTPALIHPTLIHIETLVVSAPNAIVARRLADALPAALERALSTATGSPAAGKSNLDAGELRASPAAPGFADRVASRLVAALLPGQTI